VQRVMVCMGHLFLTGSTGAPKTAHIGPHDGIKQDHMICT